MIEGINHIGYWTDDLAAAVQFYQTTFGARVLDEVDGDDGTRYVFVSVGATIVELIKPADPLALAGQRGLILNHVAYQVSDMALAIETLTGRGIRFTTPTPGVAPDGLRYITIDRSSTAGALLQLVQPAPELQPPAQGLPPGRR